MGRTLGDHDDPLLVSVRSGAKFSMPGMMETVLNIGLNDVSVEGWPRCPATSGSPRTPYRRLVQMFGKTVLGLDGELFEHAIDDLKEGGVTQDTDLTAEDLAGLVATLSWASSRPSRVPPSRDPRTQLDMAVEAVFRSWNADRAILYRRQGASGRPRHRRQYLHDGLRQLRRELGHRRNLHGTPPPAPGRLRRLPRERPG